MCEVGRASGVDPVSNKEVLWGEKGPRVKPTHTLGPFWCLDKLDHLAIMENEFLYKDLLHRC